MPGLLQKVVNRVDDGAPKERFFYGSYVPGLRHLIQRIGQKNEWAGPAKQPFKRHLHVGKNFMIHNRAGSRAAQPFNLFQIARHDNVVPLRFKHESQ